MRAPKLGVSTGLSRRRRRVMRPPKLGDSTGLSRRRRGVMRPPKLGDSAGLSARCLRQTNGCPPPARPAEMPAGTRAAGRSDS